MDPKRRGGGIWQVAGYLLLAALGMGVANGLWRWHGAGAPPSPPAPIRPPAGLEQILLPQPQPVGDFRLIDMNGAPFGPAQLRGGWTFLFFGFTHCPDLCPTTLTVLHQVHRRLNAGLPAGDEVRYLFVSVDPRRDTPELLKGFVRFFDQAFLAATGADQRALHRLTDPLGIAYLFTGDTSGDDYGVAHSATLLLIDPRGRLYARLEPPFDPAEVAARFVHIRDFYRNGGRR